MKIQEIFNVFNFWKYLPKINIELANNPNKFVLIKVYNSKYDYIYNPDAVVLKAINYDGNNNNSEYNISTLYKVNYILKNSVKQYSGSNFYISPLPITLEKYNQLLANNKTTLAITNSNQYSPIFSINSKGGIKTVLNFNDYNNLSCNVAKLSWGEIKLSLIDFSQLLIKLKNVKTNATKINIINDLISNNDIFKDLKNAITNNVSEYTIGFLGINDSNKEILKSIFNNLHSFIYVDFNRNNPNADIVFIDENSNDFNSKLYQMSSMINYENSNFVSDTETIKSLFYFPYWYEDLGAYEHKISNAQITSWYFHLKNFYSDCIDIQNDKEYKELSIDTFVSYFVNSGKKLSIYILYGFGLIKKEIIHYINPDEDYIEFNPNTTIPNNADKIFNFVKDNNMYYIPDSQALISLIKLQHYIYQNLYQILNKIYRNLDLIEKTTNKNKDAEKGDIQELLEGDYTTVISKLKDKDDFTNVLINMISQILNINDIYSLLNNFNIFNTTFKKEYSELSDKINTEINTKDLIIKNNDINASYIYSEDISIDIDGYTEIENKFDNENIIVQCWYKVDDHYVELIPYLEHTVSGRTDENDDGVVELHSHTVNLVNEIESVLTEETNKKYIEVEITDSKIKVINKNIVALNNVKVVVDGYFI